MLTVRIQEKNHSESIMVLKLKDGSAEGRKEENSSIVPPAVSAARLCGNLPCRSSFGF